MILRESTGARDARFVHWRKGNERSTWLRSRLQCMQSDCKCARLMESYTCHSFSHLRGIDFGAQKEERNILKSAVSRAFPLGISMKLPTRHSTRLRTGLQREQTRLIACSAFGHRLAPSFQWTYNVQYITQYFIYLHQITLCIVTIN